MSSISNMAARAFARGYSTVRKTDTVIVSVARTPLGSFGGSLSSLAAPALGSVAIKAAVERAGLSPSDIEEAYLGNVVSAGIGQSPARQATLAAGIPESVDVTTINKVCASGMKSVTMAAQAIASGDRKIMLTGGFESMSNIPFFINKARFGGYKFGNGELLDALVVDGLQDPYSKKMMGTCGDVIAKEENFSREDQDEFAINSYKRAAHAWENGLFDDEVVPVTIKGRKGDTVVAKDEEYTRINFDKVSSLRPAFNKDGTVTAANASTINDGAAALVVMHAAEAEVRGIKPLARIVSYADAAQAPVYFTTAPTLAMKSALAKANLSASDMDYCEINEAFAVVAMVNARNLGIPFDRVNVQGGACALGHPLGASGARIIGTLMSVLKNKDASMGIAAICNGGGAATSIIIERLN